MAGLEKVCEFSGEYPGSLMYGYKRNLIQIMPKYRKLFRGADAYVEINRVTPVIAFPSGGYTDLNEWTEDLLQYKGNRILNEYYFTLVVSNPELKGEVSGRYYNWTFDLKDTLKRLKRLLKCRNLKVIYNLEK